MATFLSDPITQKNPTSKYEAKAVALLGLGFGLLALDRWSLATLFPEISKDLHLNYQDLGNLTGILAIAWGITAIVVGRAADHFGRRKVLLPAVIGFSLMAGFAGLATGFLALYLMRMLMGVFEGAYAPVSIAATTRPRSLKGAGLTSVFSSVVLRSLALALDRLSRLSS